VSLHAPDRPQYYPTRNITHWFAEHDRPIARQSGTSSPKFGKDAARLLDDAAGDELTAS
jgi:hypothetical protein